MTGACRSLDTVSIFARTAASALMVLDVCIVKTFYDNLDTIKGDLRMLEENTLEGALDGNPIDVRPGAARYYKGRGLM